MSLNFDYSKCARQDLVCQFGDEDDNGTWIPDPKGKYKKPLPVTEAAIWLLMAIDMTEITDKNLPEVYTRMRMWEHCMGPMRRNNDGPVYMTYADLVVLIGLRTNVSLKTPKQFNDKLVKAVRAEAGRSLQHEMDKAEEALREVMAKTESKA